MDSIKLLNVSVFLEKWGIYSKARRRAFRRPKGVSDKFPNVIDGNWQTRRPFESMYRYNHDYTSEKEI